MKMKYVELRPNDQHYSTEDKSVECQSVIKGGDLNIYMEIADPDSSKQ